MLSDIADSLTRLTQRWVPSSFVIACVLTVTTFLAGVFLAHHSLLQCVRYWGDGFWVLLSFAMQMCLIIVTGYVVAVSPPVRRLLERVASLPGTGNGAVAAMAVTSMVLAWINWGLGIVASAMLVRTMARRNLAVDYRVLVAVAYFGMGATWHSGFSASAPLLVATPGHFMEKEIGIIPMSETIFTSFNLTLTLLVVLVMTLVAVWIHPRQEKRVLAGMSAAVGDTFGRHGGTDLKGEEGGPGGAVIDANRLDRSYLVNLVVGLAGVTWCLDYFLRRGSGSLSIDNVNFLFLVAGILLHPNPLSLLKAVEEGAQFIHGIVIQFPFYAGIYGIIQGTGLSTLVGDWFVSIASPQTFPLVIYWYSGLVNYFVPSGGSKWAIEAPYVIHAAKSLNVPAGQVVLSYAWGDMMTDLLQPFWCIPLLNAARLEFKDIMGFELVAFVVYASLTSVAFLLMGLL